MLQRNLSLGNDELQSGPNAGRSTLHERGISISTSTSRYNACMNYKVLTLIVKRGINPLFFYIYKLIEGDKDSITCTFCFERL